MSHTITILLNFRNNVTYEVSVENFTFMLPGIRVMQYQKPGNTMHQYKKNPTIKSDSFFFYNLNFRIKFDNSFIEKNYNVTWSSFQISSTYSLMVLSDVNLPEQATFIIAM